MKALDEPVAVTLAAYQWVGLLGYLFGVGCGDELEAYHWIASQVNKQVRSSDDDGHI